MPNTKPKFHFEKHFWNSGFEYVAGIDEAGVAPLAGPVVAAAVILKPGTTLRNIPKVRDSKMLSPELRSRLFRRISDRCMDYGVGIAMPEEVDSLNIHHATLLAMTRAAEQLKNAEVTLIDGIYGLPETDCVQMTIVKGDTKVASIAAASIIAKVTRDNMMLEYSKEYSEYGFERHKGYPTKFHISKILEFGPTPIHRRSFLKNYL